MKRSSAALLTLVIVLLLVGNSADFFFRQSYYETWDSAANSLSVNRAKHFAQLYGPYSRWGFHHPGPAAFYVQAFGEWLFYDTLHWTRTPFPAQTLAHVAVMGGFFVAALMIFGHWLPAGRARWWFLCAALAGAALHFGAMERVPSYDVLLGLTTFLSTWSAHALVLPFLCLLAAGASVAAGRGEDLPVLALASGYLLQLHVAQPMFVGPVCLLAYAALLWRATRQAPGTPGAEPGPVNLGRRLGRAWRAFPRAHVLAAVILGVFVAPFVVDLCKGSHSNVAAILRHLHEYHSSKPFERSWFYFLQFGAYAPYTTVGNAFADYDRAGMRGFLRAHAAIYTLWGLVALLCAWALLSGPWGGRGVEVAVAAPAGGFSPGRGDARRFRAWAAGFLLLTVALTLRWNTTQDGDMFYFNSWFTFALYYFGALIALAVGCSLLPAPALTSARAAAPGRSGLPRGERLLGVAAVLVVAGLGAHSLRFYDPDPAATQAMHDDVRRAEAVSRAVAGGGGGGADPVKTLIFGYDTAPVAVAVALQLERDHVPFVTQKLWQVFIGGRHHWSNAPLGSLHIGPAQSWRFAHRAEPERRADTDLHVTAVPSLLNFLPPRDDIYIRCADAPIDPAAPGGASINFMAGGNAPEYIIDGWSGAEPWGTWSDDSRAILSFRPVPVPDDGGTVEITLLDLLPLVDPGHGLVQQRLRVFFADEALGDEARLSQSVKSLVLRLPAVAWNRQAAAPAGLQCRLELGFPDATSPFALDPKVNKDTRRLAVGISGMRFRFVPPAAAPSP